MSAQRVYADLVRTSFGPRLRAAGLRGSAGRYRLPSATHIAKLGLQKSVYSDRTKLKFTVNLLCVSIEDWSSYRLERPHLPADPSAGVLWGGPVEGQRLGLLMPAGLDTWWEVAAGADLSVGDEAWAAVVAYGLPWLRARS